MTEQQGEITLSQLYQKYVASVSSSKPSYVTDEEMAFVVELSKVGNGFNTNPKNMNGLQKYVKNMVITLTKSYDKLFHDTNTVNLFQYDSKEWQTLVNILKGLKVDTLSYYGLLMIGHTLLFLLRVTRRAIYKYKLDEINDENSKSNIPSALLALFTHTNTTIQHIVEHDAEVTAYLQKILEKAKGHDTNDTNITTKYLDKLLQNANEKEQSSIHVVDLALPTTLNTNIGIDEQLLLLDTSYGIEQIMKDDTKGYNKAKRLVERLKSNIQSKYHKIFEHTTTTNMLNEDKWNLLQQQIGDVKLDNLSFSGLATIGNALLFLLRSTRKIIYQYKLANLVIHEQGKVDTINTTQELDNLFQYIGSILSNIQKIVATSNAQAKSILESASAFDGKLLDIALQDIPRNMFNFQSLARNLIELFLKFDSIKNSKGTDESNKATKTKILKAEKNGRRYLEKVFANSSLKNTIAFLTDYTDATINMELDKADYNGLKKALMIIRDTNSLQHNIRKTLQGKGKEEVKRVLQKLKELVYPSSKLYFNCLELYEFLSGTIRIVVRKKDDYDKAKQGDKPTYDITLHQTTNIVSFDGVDDIYQTYFGNTSLVTNGKVYNTFGPFYGLYPRETATDATTNAATKQMALEIAREKANKVAKDIIENALNFDTLLTTIKEHSTNMVLYSYGYSGSGKTFNFFGKLKEKEYDFGIVFKLFSKLKEHGVTIELLKRIKVYGVLETEGGTPEDNRFAFKDYVLPLEYNGVNTVEQWAITIQQDLERKQAELLDFVKATSNNQDSSRGFYMLKFKVFPKDNPHKESYIGVVDMAGNEDPFDISNAMIPTLNMSNFQTFLKGELDASMYDVVYEEIKSVVLNIIVIVLLFLLMAKRKSTIYNTHLDLVNNEKSIIYQELAVLPRIREKLIALINHSLTTKTKLEPDKLLSLDPDKNLLMDYNGDEFETKFVVTKNLIIDILIDRIGKLNTAVQPYKDKLNLKEAEDKKAQKMLNLINNEASLASIQEISAISKIEEEKSLKDLLILKKLEYMKIYLEKKVSTDAEWQDLKLSISCNTKDMVVPTDINNGILSKFQVEGKKKAEQAAKNADKNDGKKIATNYIRIPNISKQISNHFCNPKYMLPVLLEDGTYIHYKYSNLLQIVKEGYYINKAIAELIHFFQTKRNYEDSNVSKTDNSVYTTQLPQPPQPPQITNVNEETHKECSKFLSTIPARNKNILLYPFEGNFDFKNYNKFSAKFHVNPEYKDVTISKYDTSLVQTIYNEFGDDNVKHIMFACVRNLDQVDKIIGAISTLYLVQDLKST